MNIATCKAKTPHDRHPFVNEDGMVEICDGTLSADSKDLETRYQENKPG